MNIVAESTWTLDSFLITWLYFMCLLWNMQLFCTTNHFQSVVQHPPLCIPVKHLRRPWPGRTRRQPCISQVSPGCSWRSCHSPGIPGSAVLDWGRNSYQLFCRKYFQVMEASSGSSFQVRELNSESWIMVGNSLIRFKYLIFRIQQCKK